MIVSQQFCVHSSIASYPEFVLNVKMTHHSNGGVGFDDRGWKPILQSFPECLYEDAVVLYGLGFKLKDVSRDGHAFSPSVYRDLSCSWIIQVVKKYSQKRGMKDPCHPPPDQLALVFG